MSLSIYKFNTYYISKGEVSPNQWTQTKKVWGSNPPKQKGRRTVASLFLFASSKLSPSPCHPPLKKIKISLSKSPPPPSCPHLLVTAPLKKIKVSLSKSASKHAKHAPLSPTAVSAFSPRFPSSSAAQGQLLHQQLSPFTSSYPRVDKEAEKKKKKWIKKIENAPSWGGLQKRLQNFKEPLPKLVFILHKCVI